MWDEGLTINKIITTECTTLVRRDVDADVIQHSRKYGFIFNDNFLVYLKARPFQNNYFLLI